MRNAETGLTIGSLFAGIGGLELGLERAGHGPVLWQVERDAYCQRVLAKHWPSAKRYDDVCAVGAGLGYVDIICGGFPCQDLSYAGKGAGLSGKRSGLWFEFSRIIREVRPRFVVVENVAALLARGMGVVLGDLAASGYDATWDCIPAAAVGAPHRRDRVFVVGYAGFIRRDTRRTWEPLPWARVARETCPWRKLEPNVGRVADGVPARVDRLRALGNAVVPQCAQVAGEVIKLWTDAGAEMIGGRP